MKKIELKIPGGILSVSFLRNLCLMLHSYNIENIYLGNRQNIILYLKEENYERLSLLFKKNNLLLQDSEFNLMLDWNIFNEDNWLNLNSFEELLKTLINTKLPIQILQKIDEISVLLSPINLIADDNKFKFYIFINSNNQSFLSKSSFTLNEVKDFFYQQYFLNWEDIIINFIKNNYNSFDTFFNFQFLKSYLIYNKQLEFNSKIFKKLSHYIILSSYTYNFSTPILEKLCFILKKHSIGYIFINPYHMLEIPIHNNNLLIQEIHKLFNNQNYIIYHNQYHSFPNNILRLNNFEESSKQLVNTLIRDKSIKTHNNYIVLNINESSQKSLGGMVDIFIQKSIFRRGKRYDFSINPFIKPQNYKNLNQNQLIKTINNFIEFMEHYDYLPNKEIENLSIKIIEKERIKQCIECFTVLSSDDSICPICESKNYQEVLSPTELIAKNFLYKNLR